MKKEILKAIEEADERLICEIIKAVISRYGEIFPDWEVLFLSVRRAARERIEDIDAHIRYLEEKKKRTPSE